MASFIEPIQLKQPLGDDGILFVRNDDILDTMVKTFLLVVSVIIVAALIPTQSSFSSPRALDLIIYPDGSTHISTEIDLDPFQNDYDLDLFGSTIDNLVVIGDNEFLLTTDVMGDSALIQTFGSSIISVEYDIHDLVSKQGRLWTFSLDSPSEFTLLLPKNSAIVGMTNLPINMEILDDQNQLTLSSGKTEIDYFYSTNLSDSITNIETESNNVLYVIIGGVMIFIIIGFGIMIHNKQKNLKLIQNIQTIQKNNVIDIEMIFKLKPDLREDDKELVKFIFNSGGEVLESELRKKFLQPRTTMWRAVKRLEREGVIDIEKKDLQNLVKIRKNMEKQE
ncbi:MAG: MarR family transcriptional regulator [Nitrosopumilus sp.]|nr:MarR family transcriptional regulator [Nitrosopumilus sp.]